MAKIRSIFKCSRGPDASFIEEEIEKLSVWLKYPRINQNGSEKELLES